MALKNKKCLPLSEQKKENTEEEEVKDTEREAGEEEPYKVFETEEEFREAVRREMEKQNNGAGAKEGGYGRESGAAEGSNMLIDKWQRDARALKEIVPEFELSEVLRDPNFTDVLRKGGSIVEAYAAISKMPKQPERDAIYQNAHMAQRGTGEATRNPAKLSSQDFKDYIDNIKNR